MGVLHVCALAVIAALLSLLVAFAWLVRRQTRPMNRCGVSERRKAYSGSAPYKDVAVNEERD
jgi:hypothetical protein